MMITIFIIVGTITLFTGFMGYALCRVAGRADRQIERDFDNR
jgi:hypothetical protein